MITGGKKSHIPTGHAFGKSNVALSMPIIAAFVTDKGGKVNSHETFSEAFPHFKNFN